VSHPYRQTKWPVRWKIIPSPHGHRTFVKEGQSEIHSGSVSVYGRNVFSPNEVSLWCNKFKDGRTALIDDPEKHQGRRTLMKILLLPKV
jgi:hypothetical protein